MTPNFHGDFTLDGKVYPSLEHAYQASRFVEPAIRDKIARAPTAGAAVAQAKLWPTSTPGWEKAAPVIREGLLDQVLEGLDDLI